jgi:hypothetical protein
VTHPLINQVILQCKIGVGRELDGGHGHAIPDGHSLEVDAGALTQLRCLVHTVGNRWAVVTLCVGVGVCDSKKQCQVEGALVRRSI